MEYDPNNREQSFEIVATWRHLMLNKKIQARKVFQRIPKEELTAEQLEDPIIASKVEGLGYLDIDKILWPKEILDVLDFFVKLGYVDKYTDTIHQISFHYAVHPYVPYISPSGRLGISGSSTSSTKIIELDSKSYSDFVRTARDFQNQRVSGKHPHITEFNYGENFHYQSDVYEVKDRYFDAIEIGYRDGLLNVYLTDPGIRTRNKTPRKLWKRAKQLDLNLFLSGNQYIDKYVELEKGLCWHNSP